MFASQATTQSTRPALVPLIAAFYLASAGWTLLFFTLIKLGVWELSASLQTKFNSNALADPALTLLAAAAECCGAIALWRFRKSAFLAFSLALAFTMVLALSRLIDLGLFAALGGAGLFATLFGWGILGAVCAYTWNLIKAGILTE